jgi:hypothetical protein
MIVIGRAGGVDKLSVKPIACARVAGLRCVGVLL